VNYYYYKLAYDMGIDRLAKYMHRYGFGEPTGIDLTGENGGVVPSPEWKARNSREPWYPGETVIAGIGQGYWIATTLQLARGTAALAADGVLRRPHLARDRRDGFRSPWTPVPQPAPRRLSDNIGYIRAVQGGMEGTIYDPGGTGRAMAVGASYRMAGKTGTAQRVSRKGNVSTNPHSLPLHLRHQAWFIGYAPTEDPRIAVAVMVEHGGYGGSTAAPIARKLFDGWLLGKYPEADPDAIPVTAIGARAVVAQASPTPASAARAAIPDLDAATVELFRGGPGAAR
jgi:penicillin-binding protein 2